MDHFNYRNGILHAEDVPIPTLATEAGTPFYCYSTATLQRHYQVFRDGLGIDKAMICYAAKANSNRAVLATLGKLGCGADVVSEGEIMLARSAGIPASSIVFSGVGKSPVELAYALSQGIFQFNVESEPELLALNDVAQSLNHKAPVALRVNPDVQPDTHAKISTGQKGSKFGISIEEARSLYRIANELPGIQVQGVSIHIGSQLTSLTPFAEAYRKIRRFVEELLAQGLPIHTLDLGGGLGVPYAPGETVPTPAEYGAVVRETVGDLPVQLLFEPGRLLVGNAGVLVTRVLYVKRSENRVFVVVDAAMNDLLRPSLYDAYHDIVPVREAAANAERSSVDVVGPVCESGDIFAEQRSLPLPASGDLLAFRTAGAYGAAMASNYNSRLLVAEAMVHGDRHKVVRPRQSYEALIQRDTIPEWAGNPLPQPF